MVLADVVEVVGHRAAHVQRRIVLEQFEQLDDRPRILLKGAQPRRPGQPWPRALGDQPAHVLARIPCPLAQPCQGCLRVFLEERANAVFGREALREHMLRAHGLLEVPESVLRHVEQVRHEVERRHAARGAVFMRLGCRGQQDVDGRGIFLGQMFAQRRRNVKSPTGQRQGPVARERVGEKGIVRKSGVHRADARADGARHALAELVLELARQA